MKPPLMDRSSPHHPSPALPAPSPLLGGGAREGVRGASLSDSWLQGAAPPGSVAQIPCRGRACLLTVLFVASALGLAPGIAHARLNVIATTADLAALAREIGGDRVEVTTLAKPTEDAHFVDAKPSFIVKLNRADALIEGGAELEAGWLPPLLERARNPKLAPKQPGRILCAQGVEMLEVPATLDRSQGDIHAAGNPHFTTDPLNGRLIAATLTAAFAQLEPASAGVFRANQAKFDERLQARLAEWQKLLAPFAGRRVVTYHNSWIYFARRFGIKMDVFLEPKPGLPPTPAHLAAVVARMKAEQIQLIVSEPHLNRKTAETVAGHTGARLLDFASYPGGLKAGEGYLEWMDALVRSLARGFEAGR